MTYRELLIDIIKHGTLDEEAYVVEWTRNKHGIVDAHKTHYPIIRFSFITNELVIETKDLTHDRI